MRNLTLSCLLIAALGTVSSGQVLINEVSANNGTNAWIELFNPTGAAVDVSGWQFNFFYDNLPGSNIGTIVLPGAPLSGVSVIQPEGFAVITDSTTLPALPVGVQRIVIGDIPAGFFAGIPYSAALFDDIGNGIDYVAGSNANFFGAPLTLGGTSTEWHGHPAAVNPVGGGLPLLGTVFAGAGSIISYRHTRLDSDDAADWTNFGTAGTPGAYNPGQTPIGVAIGVMPVAAFATNTTCGIAPLGVTFQNTTVMETEINPAAGGLVVWDFDATANPGTTVSSNHHESNSFAGGVYDVTLTVIDALGGTDTTAPTNIISNAATAITPLAACAVLDFENFPPTVADPCGGLPQPDPMTGAEYRASNGGGRFRVVPNNSLAIGWPFPNATAGSGPNVLILDATSAAAGNPINKFILHVDTTQLSPTTGEFTLTYSVLENNDEGHSHDYVAIQDGLTAGNEGNALTGGFGSQPGVDGLAEVVVQQWNLLAINRVWATVTHTLDAAFFAGAGLVLGSPDLRIIFAQEDNVTFEGNDGVAFDQIELLDLAASGGGPMQPSDTSRAAMDINTGLNAACNFVSANDGGPFFTEATFGQNMTLQFFGQPNQPIIFMTDLNNTLTDNVLVLPGAGELNIGTLDPMAPLGVSDIGILANGTSPDFLNQLFKTDATGQVTLSIPTTLPIGVTVAFQSLFFASPLMPGGLPIQFSNPIALTIL